MDCLISLENVSIGYHIRKSWFKKEYYRVLTDVSFNVNRGEVLGVLGRNGAGKSTLLKIMAGILPPDQGMVVHNVNHVSLMTFQSGFDQNLNGYDNSILSGILAGFSKSEVESKIDQIRDYSELLDFFYEPIKTYSSGMKARLGFSIAAYLRPDVILIDEALSVGDKSFNAKANATIMEMVASDQTIVVVSHSISLIKKLCTRVLEVENGRIVSCNIENNSSLKIG